MSPDGEFSALGTGGPVVGAGAPAGGLGALRFLPAAPSDGGACGPIRHGDPTVRNHRPERLARRTSMPEARDPVAPVEDGAALGPDRVCPAPPDRAMRLDGARIRPAAVEPPGLRPTLDSIFRGMAGGRGGTPACVVLSGTGPEGPQGATGLRAVREAGGPALVQSPGTAEHDGMPQGAAETGPAGRVVAIDRMPRLSLSCFGRSRRVPEAPGEDRPAVCRRPGGPVDRDFPGSGRNAPVPRMARRLRATGASHEAHVALIHDDNAECAPFRGPAGLRCGRRSTGDAAVERPADALGRVRGRLRGSEMADVVAPLRRAPAHGLTAGAAREGAPAGPEGRARGVAHDPTGAVGADVAAPGPEARIPFRRREEG